VLDTRPSNQFFAGHVPGAIHIALAGQYASWAATLVGLDRDIILIAEDEEHVEESAHAAIASGCGTRDWFTARGNERMGS
jgi:hypothetical protein